MEQKYIKEKNSILEHKGESEENRNSDIDTEYDAYDLDIHIPKMRNFTKNIKECDAFSDNLAVDEKCKVNDKNKNEIESRERHKISFDKGIVIAFASFIIICMLIPIITSGFCEGDSKEVDRDKKVLEQDYSKSNTDYKEDAYIDVEDSSETGKHQEHIENNTSWNIDMNKMYYAMATNYTVDEFIEDINVEPFDKSLYLSTGSVGRFYSTFGEYTGELQYCITDEFPNFYLELGKSLTESEVAEIFDAIPITAVEEGCQTFTWNEQVVINVYYLYDSTMLFFSLYDLYIDEDNCEDEESNNQDSYDVFLKQILANNSTISMKQAEQYAIILSDSVYGILPHDFEYDKFGDYNDAYTIYDIDSDGVLELIVAINDTCVAGMLEIVYEYDEYKEELIEQFIGRPGSFYYENGAIKVPWSHNQGLGRTIHPFTLYRYLGNNEYEEVASIDSWDKAVNPCDYDGNEFPEHIDVDGDGTIFFVIKNYERTMCDGAEYERLVNEVIKGNQIELDWVEY